MRKLSETYLHTLKSDFLKQLIDQVRSDKDLDLEIRNNYLNIYYKGNSLLKLDQVDPQRYRATVHPKFSGEVELPDFVDSASTASFISRIPHIKENIIRFGKSSLEIEYEQMIIRANNYEPRNNSEYFIVDRQYVAPKEGRFDLTGFYWPSNLRRKGQVVSPCLIEIKFALNQDIQDLHDQLSRYYQAIRCQAAEIAEETETVLRQKLDLGLFTLPANRLAAMQTLTLARQIDSFYFVVILVDYNPKSKLFKPEKLAALPFASQVRIFKSGFAMWDSKVLPINQAG